MRLVWGSLAVLVLVLAWVLHLAPFHSEVAATVAAPVGPEPTKVAASNWTVTATDVNSMDGIATQFVNSEDRGVYLHLCFKSSGLCDVPISVQAPRDCFIESNVPYDYGSYVRRVRIKFDDEKPLVQLWGITDSHNAIFPHGSQSTFLGQLLKHDRFSVELNCASHESDVVTLDIAGLSEAIATVSVKHRPI